MKTAGIIAEYNPFHNGHKKQIDTLRDEYGFDNVIIAMSGMFTQRGEPALLDKWSRAEAALRCGADLVFELPCLFALREAEGFARGGVGLLSGLGIVDVLAFGCEPDTISLIEPTAKCLGDEDEAFRSELCNALSVGMSYPRARAIAAAKRLGLTEMPNLPNFTLGVEYARANAALEAPMKLLPIPREGGHCDMAISAIASSGAIRAALARGEATTAFAAMPHESALILKQALHRAASDIPRAIGTPSALSEIALYALRLMPPEALREYAGVSEGLEYLLIKSARAASSLDEALMLAKSRRYTLSRLRRVIPQVLLGITREFQLLNPNPIYARLLGARRSALPLLKEIKRRGALPLVTDATRLKGDPVWELETRATDLWGLCTEDSTARRSGWDYTHGLVIN